MELNKDLHILIERARELYDKLNDRIHHDAFSFCRHCSGQGLLCGIPEMTLEERGRLFAIRDSLKEVQDMLVFLQKLELCHQGNICSALARLDQCRMCLIERISRYPNPVRKLDVLEELQACFCDPKTSPDQDFKEKTDEKIGTGVSHYLANCIRNLFSPRNWYCATHMAIKFLVIYAGVSSSVYIHTTITDSNNVSSVNSLVARRQKLLPTDSSSSLLAVTRGRG